MTAFSHYFKFFLQILWDFILDSGNEILKSSFTQKYYYNLWFLLAGISGMYFIIEVK